LTYKAHQPFPKYQTFIIGVVGLRSQKKAQNGPIGILGRLLKTVEIELKTVGIECKTVGTERKTVGIVS
jgi:F420-0:gamma-glutamyl ligase-like protein